ncbi:MAG: mechanosensitive ion channel, partial [Succinivibrionaceae bacterium]|nr:mechanosensitive ion channel [Succinivibrionaceae bacterium]
QGALAADELITSVRRSAKTLLRMAACVAIFLLWHDLAGALGYLDSVVLLEIEEERERFTLLSVVYALAAITITAFLNQHLPELLERLALLGDQAASRSGGYTLRILTSYAIIAAGVVATAAVLGISWDQLQWLVAALSVGLGFGLQEIFANFISGLIILFERKIRVGDTISKDDLTGVVETIRIRATTVITPQHQEVLIPNKEFITSAFTNWSLTSRVTGLEMVFRIAGGADPERVGAVLREIARGCRWLDHGKGCEITVQEINADYFSVGLQVFVRDLDQRPQAQDFISRQAIRRFAEEGIEFAPAPEQ